MNYSKSKKWTVRNCNVNTAKKIKRKYNYNDINCRWIATRVEDDEVQLDHWLEPKLQKLGDPYLLKGTEDVASVLSRQIKKNSRILIYSDYDVDGITSATLFYRALSSLGVQEMECFIPDRIEEGYGLTLAGWERARERINPDYIIILDCGTHSENVIKIIRDETGADGVIIDHHSALQAPSLPAGWKIINPHLPEFSQKEYQVFCTAGLTFKVLHALIKKLEEEEIDARNKVELKNLLDLVAVGTIADLVPLREENRILTRAGLQCLNRTRNAGLKALMEVSQISSDQLIHSADVAFRIGPRINAGGRVEDPSLPLKLLLTDDTRASFEMAQRLNGINDKRKSIEKKVYLEAAAQAESDSSFGIVLSDEKWHPGVVGIVAGRLSRDFHRPTIILGWDGENYKGSGRSINGIDLMQVMELCETTPEKWGGHPMAMGLTISASTLPDFKVAFAQAVENFCQGELPSLETIVDTWALPNELNRSCFLEIETFGPYGIGNPVPSIGIREVVLSQPPKSFGKDHIRFPLESTEGIEVVGWRMQHNPPPVGRPLDLAVYLQRNFWKNREFLRAELLDWRISPESL